MALKALSGIIVPFKKYMSSGKAKIIFPTNENPDDPINFYSFDSVNRDHSAFSYKISKFSKVSYFGPTLKPFDSLPCVDLSLRNIQFKDFDHGSGFPMSFDHTYSRLININHKWLNNNYDRLEIEISWQVSPASGDAVYFLSDPEWVEFIRIREISVFIIGDTID